MHNLRVMSHTEPEGGAERNQALPWGCGWDRAALGPPVGDAWRAEEDVVQLDAGRMEEGAP